jgi:hypothetical protein
LHLFSAVAKAPNGKFFRYDDAKRAQELVIAKELNRAEIYYLFYGLEECSSIEELITTLQQINITSKK